MRQFLKSLHWPSKTINAVPCRSIEKPLATRNCFRISGPDPQCLLTLGGKSVRLKPGVYNVIFATAPGSSQLFRPKLYLDHGDGFSEAATVNLARHAPNQWRCTLNVLKAVKRLRLDPSETASGEFAIEQLAITKSNLPPASGADELVNKNVFCAAPFVQSLVTTAGQVKPCPVFLSPAQPQAGSSREPFWNSAELRTVRRQLVQGERPDQCRACKARENSGVRSVRQIVNRAWELGWGNPAAMMLQDLATQATPDFAMAQGPSWVELNLGNLCQLRCRTCSPASSSRIASDPVQARWTDSDPSRTQRYNEGGRWLADPNWFTETLGADLSHLTKLELKGGEPFLIKAVPSLLQKLIDLGRAAEVELVIVTSGTLAPSPLLTLLEVFSQITLLVSVDGVGDLNEYIRDGSRWTDVVANIALFQQLPNISLTLTATVQAYNMLQITDVADFALARNLNLSCNMLRDPEYLSCFAMPASARAEAADRIRRYLTNRAELDAEFASTKEALLYTANCLEKEPATGSDTALVDFKAYTSDLDVARAQSFQKVGFELIRHLDSPAGGAPA